MINFSIIIPHKNIPYLLQRCLDSIPRREDVQIIIVDDNSDSEEVDFRNFPGLNDPYVEVIFGKNEENRKGAGYARNLGLERAKGKWLIFADADDFFMPCFNEILNEYINDENDIIYFKITSVNSETLQPAMRHQYIVDKLDEIQKMKKNDLLYELSGPIGKFISRDVVEKNKIRFQEVQCSNDVFFSVKCVLFSSAKKIVNDIVYCSTEREGSLVNTQTIDTFKIRFKVELEVNCFLKLYGIYSRFWIMCGWFDAIYKYNKIEAFFLIPSMIRVCGVKYISKFCRSNNFYGYGNFRLLLKKIKNRIV